jgi:hypothetical protein
VVKLYVEGGGSTAALKTECREAFTKFITAAGLSKRPRVVACGSRQDAYNSYCTAVQSGEAAILLVDSEEAVSFENQKGLPEAWKPWSHLGQRVGDKWEKPANSNETDCHLMTQLMESWFLADSRVLQEFFGQSFKEKKLPAIASGIENISKDAVYSALHEATSDCTKKGKYGKGAHSFKILGILSPEKVVKVSPWAKRFLEELKKKMNE